MNTYKDVQSELRSTSNLKQKEKAEYFFKTDDGCYSAHDKFIGVRMPDIRKTAQVYVNLSHKECEKLLQSQIHEERMCALIILVLQMKSAVKKKDHKTVEEICQFYLSHKEYVNNWDLVDASAHYILGQYVVLYPDKSAILYDLADSKSLWDRRIAMVSQWFMIREGEYAHVLRLAGILLCDDEDLMHKAVGWMLREYWKREPHVVEDFIKKYYVDFPRTTLRYTIEKMEEEKRKKFLNGNIS